MSTEDCVTELNKQCYQRSWKRKSKSGNETIGIKRTFQSASMVAEILEKNGKLTVLSINPIGEVIPTVVEAPVIPPPTPITPIVQTQTNQIIPDNTIQEFVQKHFGNTPTALDYKVVAAAITLRAILPPSFASTAMVKALRGTAKAKMGQNNPAFGIAEGIKKYTQTILWNLVEDIQEFLKSGDVMEMEQLYESDEDRESDNQAPIFLTDYQDSQHKVNKVHCLAVAEAFNQCATKYGVNAPEPEKRETNRAKPEDIQEKLTKSGIWGKAVKQASSIRSDFLEKNPGWENGWRYKDFRSKSMKGNIMTMKFYLNKPIYKKSEDKNNWRGENKCCVLTTSWDKEDLQNWEVTLEDFES